MREALFRGKRVDTGEWVYGYLFKYHIGWDFRAKDYRYEDILAISPCINPLADHDGDVDFEESYEVIPESVGQYTGLEANGQKIFEGDILDVNYNGPLFGGYNTEAINYKGKVIYKENIAMYCCEGKNRGDALYALDENEIEVVGNVTDNSELLEVEE